MLDENIKTQLTAYLAKLTEPVELRASLDDSEKSRELSDLLNEIASLSEKLTFVRTDDDARRPSFAIVRTGTDISVRFAAIPMGHEFNSLILALLQVGGVVPKLDAGLTEQIKDLSGEYNFEVYLSLSCQNCPDVVQALNAMSVLNPKIKPVSIDGALYQDEVEKRQVMAVPTVFLNGAPFGQGRMSAEEIVHKLDAGAAHKKAAELSAKEPFEVLVIGGGPAGATAAIYAARKGLRTGIVADRFGGQVLDTVSIENFISVPYTEGPKLGAALEEHVKHYDVDIMYLQRAEKLIPAQVPGGLHTVELASGATLKSRTVIISTGASWRQMNVPGEHEYLTKGVTYCPHCDGPLFKGKRVAVIGGGNSGFEAAIDLAGLASHVTVLEFADSLRADAVLQAKLKSMGNTDVIMSAQTTEVLGDGSKVTGLAYQDRVSGEAKTLDIDGIFVQIGLVPNARWLKDVVKLSPRGEIEIDAHGATSVPGVFAAGDVSTVPYKQIVIALGEGAKASLGAFDYLIRTKPAEEKQAAE